METTELHQEDQGASSHAMIQSNMAEQGTRVLLIANDPAEANVLLELLPEDHGLAVGIECADHLSAGLERLAKGGIDAVLLDLSLPDSQGLDALSKVHARAPELPIIVLTDINDQEAAIEALKSGAQDSLVKGELDTDLLVRSLRFAIERKRAELEALRKHEVKYRTIFENASEPIIYVDSDCIVIDANEKTESIFGYRPSEVVGHSILDLNLFWPDEMKRVVQLLTQARTGKFSQLEELHVRHKRGHMVPVEVSTSPVEDDSGIHGFLTIVRDISERREAETRLARYTADLKRSNEELEQFAYVASHDLEEPLRMVRSYVQLLARRYEGKFDPEADEFIKFAVEGASHMQSLIDSLLTYSRVTTRGREFRPVDCEEVMVRTLAHLKAAIEKSKAVITYDALPRVSGDEVQLSQLFQNLISNAIKFHGEEPPNVHISAKKEDSHWVFSVKDKGIGIEHKYAERIFIIFQRLHGQEEYPGSGIGLAVCRRIVERHGGRIWVESEPGHGSTFYFSLPASGGKQA